ncbi:MAG: hypothetical protein D6812_08790 [Deltaproteobacteria bacterium]|nr:MAG: hypothetical protein D6812_08790 [Deltaproteobacteria bacterium]
MGKAFLPSVLLRSVAEILLHNTHFLHDITRSKRCHRARRMSRSIEERCSMLLPLTFQGSLLAHTPRIDLAFLHFSCIIYSIRQEDHLPNIERRHLCSKQLPSMLSRGIIRIS